MKWVTLVLASLALLVASMALAVALTHPAEKASGVDPAVHKWRVCVGHYTNEDAADQIADACGPHP